MSTGGSGKKGNVARLMMFDAPHSLRSITHWTPLGEDDRNTGSALHHMVSLLRDIISWAGEECIDGEPSG